MKESRAWFRGGASLNVFGGNSKSTFVLVRLQGKCAQIINRSSVGKLKKRQDWDGNGDGTQSLPYIARKMFGVDRDTKIFIRGFVIILLELIS